MRVQEENNSQPEVLNSDQSIVQEEGELSLDNLEAETIDIDDAANDDEGEQQSEPETEDKPKADESTFLDFDDPKSITPDRVKARVNADYRKLAQQAKELERYRREERERKQKEFEATKPKEVPLPTEDDFLDDPVAAQQKQQAAIEAAQKAAEWNAQKAQMDEAEAAEQRQAQQQLVSGFLERSQAAGISQAAISTAGAIVDQAGISPTLADYLMGYEQGPQVVKYLADNAQALSDIVNAPNELVAVEKIQRLAGKLNKKTVSTAPPPAAPLNGAGVRTDNTYGGLLDGATFS